MAQDVRFIANIVLEIASKSGNAVSNLSINKIVYFLHEAFLAKFSRPLVSAKIEAWEYGPVFRELYHEFKKYGQAEIAHSAKCIDLKTGEMVRCWGHLDQEESEFLEQNINKLLGIPASKLVKLSHTQGGPWHTVWTHSGSSNPGMRISDELILQYIERQARH